MTILRRILLVISLVVAGAGVWALTHGNMIGSISIARPVLIVALVIAGLIAAVSLVTEAIMILSHTQHPEPEDPPLPPPVVPHKPESTPEPEETIKKTFDAVEQAEEYLSQTRHRISVVIEEDDPDDDPESPKTPPTVV